jgi:hypothetical protein
MNYIPQTYFSAADRQMEVFLQKGSFYRHLVFSMLFQGDLIVPDIFFYISNNIRNLAEDEKQPLLLSALTEGMIVPSFRSDVEGSFVRNLAEIRDQSIQGVLYESERLAQILDKSVANSRHYAYTHWPNETLSEGYEQVVRKTLLASDPPDDDVRFVQLWDETRTLRESVVSHAIEGIRGKGLRRGELYNALARFYHIDLAVVNDVKVILRRITDPDEKKKVKTVIKWINYCYHYNQGKMFKLQPSLAELDTLDIGFTRSFYSQKEENSQGNYFDTLVELPSTRQLLTIEPRRIFEVRNGETGVQYFKSLSEWQMNPSELTSKSLLEAITAYAGSIRTAYVQYGRNVLHPRLIIKIIIPTNKGKTSDFILNSLYGFAETFIDPLGLISFVADTVACGYYIFPIWAKKAIDRMLHINEMIKLDITPQRQLIINKNLARFSADSRMA